VRDEYHPGRVELSIQAMLVPVLASESKFSIYGVSSREIDPLPALTGGNAIAIDGETINKFCNIRKNSMAAPANCLEKGTLLVFWRRLFCIGIFNRAIT